MRGPLRRRVIHGHQCGGLDHRRFTRGLDALVYYIDEATEDMRIAYPMDLFDRNITDGRMMMVSILTLVIGNNQGMGDIEHGKIHDIYFPERAIQLFDGPSKDISDMWRMLGRPIKDGGYIAGTIIKPKLGLRPSHLLRPPTSSGWVVTSSRTMNRKATRCSARPRRSTRWSTTP